MFNESGRSNLKPVYLKKTQKIKDNKKIGQTEFKLVLSC